MQMLYTIFLECSEKYHFAEYFRFSASKFILTDRFYTLHVSFSLRSFLKERRLAYDITMLSVCVCVSQFNFEKVDSF
jgi:hypothetical protein